MKTHSKFRLIIDKREHDILELIKNYPDKFDSQGNVIQWVAEHITTGDFIIFNGDKAIAIIERKTLSDLAASFRDGRIGNIAKLKNYSDCTGAKIIYLIEGKMYPSRTKKYGRIPYGNLRAHIDHLIMRDGVFELKTPNLIGTIDRLFEFIKNISSIKPAIEAKCPTTEVKGGDLEMAKIIHSKSQEEIQLGLWLAIPGINTNNYKLFVKFTLRNLLLGNVSLDEIKGLKYSNGRAISKNQAIRVYNGAKNMGANILAAIPGISKQTANIIIETYSIKDIFEKWNEIKNKIEKLPRGKKNIGKSIVANIERNLIGANNINYIDKHDK